MQTREPRQAVMIPAQLKDDLAWRNACIRNVSSHGMLLQMPNPPARGTYVELRRDSLIIVARVMWTAPGSCGLKTQEELVIPAVGDLSARRRPRSCRSLAGRRARVRSHAEMAERAALTGRRMQFFGLGAACATAVTLLALTAFRALSTPSSAIAAALS